MLSQALPPSSPERTRLKLIEAELHLMVSKNQRAVSCLLEVQHTLGPLLEYLGTPYIQFPNGNVCLYFLLLFHSS